MKAKKVKKLKKHIPLIPYILLFGVVFIAVIGYLLVNADITDGPVPFLAQPTPEPTPGEDNLLSIISAADMELIVPDKLHGDWDFLSNYSGDGTVTMMFDRPENHRVVIIVLDKRSADMARYAVTPENFSYTESGIPWEWSETQYKHRAKAMKGVYMVDNTQMGELIAYPHDRFLVIAYILGENDKRVDMQELLDKLEFQ